MSYQETAEQMKEFAHAVDALIADIRHVADKVNRLGFSQFGSGLVSSNVEIEDVTQFAYLYQCAKVDETAQFSYNNIDQGAQSITWTGTLSTVGFWIPSSNKALIAECNAYLQATGETKTRHRTIDLKLAAMEIVGDEVSFC